MAELSLLVVCLGNVCRSPLAERLLRKRIDDLLDGSARTVHVSSAGVLALVGEPMNRFAAHELRSLGGDPDGFTARQVNGAMIQDADLVLTATSQLRSRVLEEEPRALKRTFTIREFAALASSEVFRNHPATSTADLVRRAASWRGSVEIDDYDVADPIGQPEELHHDVATVLDRACAEIAQAVVTAIRPDADVL